MLYVVPDRVYVDYIDRVGASKCFAATYDVGGVHTACWAHYWSAVSQVVNRLPQWRHSRRCMSRFPGLARVYSTWKSLHPQVRQIRPRLVLASLGLAVKVVASHIPP